MPQGLEVFDASGTSVFNPQSRPTKVLGVVTIPATPNTGNVTGVSGFSLGTPFWSYVGGGVTTGLANITPVISVSGTTLSWDWSSVGGNWGASVDVIYGVY